MPMLKDKIVLITGASSGIGKACAEQFAKEGARLILTARRIDRLHELCTELKNKYQAETLPIQLDVQNKEAVKKAIEGLNSHWSKVDILINNAGLALDTLKIQEGNIENWDAMLNTNVHGLLYITHAILPGMIERQQGHIINIGSIAGYEVYPTGNVYCATKHAVRAISQALRVDLLGNNIKITEIAPGAVHTEFSEVRWKDKERADQFYSDFIPLVGDDIADAIIYATTRPAHVTIAEMTVLPVAQSSVTQIHRKK